MAKGLNGFPHQSKNTGSQCMIHLEPISCIIQFPLENRKKHITNNHCSWLDLATCDSVSDLHWTHHQKHLNFSCHRSDRSFYVLVKIIPFHDWNIVDCKMHSGHDIDRILKIIDEAPHIQRLIESENQAPSVNAKGC